MLLNRDALDATFVWVAELANESARHREQRRPPAPHAGDHRVALHEPEGADVDARRPCRRPREAERREVRGGLAALLALVDDPRFDTAAAAAASAEREAQGKDFREVLEESLKNDRLRRDPQASEGGRQARALTTKSLQTKLLEMSISEKVRMAMLGSAQEREFLVKDNNKLVHMAAVTSPKLSVKDIVSWSGSELVPDTVLAYIANHRRGMYSVAQPREQPKTPVKTSYRLVPQLVDRDLKAILRNRNVPAPTRRRAKEILTQRSKRKK